MGQYFFVRSQLLQRQMCAESGPPTDNIIKHSFHGFWGLATQKNGQGQNVSLRILGLFLQGTCLRLCDWDTGNYNSYLGEGFSHIYSYFLHFVWML